MLIKGGLSLLFKEDLEEDLEEEIICIGQVILIEGGLLSLLLSLFKEEDLEEDLVVQNLLIPPLLLTANV